jgi:2,5-diketo-D-gluconate reductase A
VPAVNQIQIDPAIQRQDQRHYDEQHGILTESWSPLGGPGAALLDDPTITTIAAARQRTPGQVVLRWHVQQGIVTIPKASHVDRLRQNLDVFDFALSDDDMARIATLATGKRVNDQSPLTWEEF